MSVLFLVVPSHYIVAVESGVIDDGWCRQVGVRDSVRLRVTESSAMYLKTSWRVGILIGTLKI